MAYFINYTMARANALKNWELITKAAPTKLFVKKDFRFWPFHKNFMNHIKNMGWSTSHVFTESGIDYNIEKYFGRVQLDTIEAEHQALKLGNTPNNTIKKLKFRGLYTWFFNSSSEPAQYFLAKESNKHRQSAPLAWNLITTNILRGVKQGTGRAKNMIHTVYLEKLTTTSSH